MTRSNYLNNLLRLSERHKGDPPQDITIFDKGRLMQNKGGLFCNNPWLFDNKA